MKRIPLILVIIIFALISFGCSNTEDGQVTENDIYKYYNSLNSRYVEVLDYYDALQNKKITKFDWRIIAESAQKTSERTIDTLKASDHPRAAQLIDIAQALAEFTNQLEQNVDKGAEIDWSYKDKVQSKLDELKPEMDQLREELMEKL